MNRSQLSETVGALAGLAFAVLLLFGFATVDPLTESTDPQLIEWWNTGANLDNIVLSQFFILASVPCFLLFLASLRGRLAAGEGGTAALSGFVLSAGTCFAAALLIAASARGAIGYSVKFGDEPLPGPDTLRYFMAFSMLIVAMVAMPAAAIMVGAASYLIARTRVLPFWLAIAGVIVVIGTGAAVALGAGAFASPLIQLWTVATGFELWRTRNAGTVPGNPAGLAFGPASAAN